MRVLCAGEIGSFYNIVQDPTHQISMRLKLGVLSDHNGTYIVSILPLHFCLVNMRPQQQKGRVFQKTIVPVACWPVSRLPAAPRAMEIVQAYMEVIRSM